MKRIILLLVLAFMSAFAEAKPKPSKYYELRIYYCHEGRLPQLFGPF